MMRLSPTFKLRGPAIALALASLAFSLAACEEEDYAVVVSSVEPFYTTVDEDTDDGLVGAWQYQDEVRFTFTHGENRDYQVTVEENGGDQHFTSRFEGHLFRLGAESFLDLYPSSVPLGSEFYFLHFFRCHTVTKVAFPGDQLEMRFLSPEWLTKQMQAGTVSVAHANSGGILLLTAPTEEMQDLLFVHSSDEEAFGEVLTFERAPAAKGQ